MHSGSDGRIFRTREHCPRLWARCPAASLGWGCRKDGVLPQVQTGGAALPPESPEPAEPTVVETSVVGRDAVWSLQKPQRRITTQIHAARPRQGREELDSFKRQLLIDSWALGEAECLARGSQADQRPSTSLGRSDPLSGPSSSSPQNGEGQKPAGEEAINKLRGPAAQTPRQPLCPSLSSSPQPSGESSLISWPPRFKHGLARGWCKLEIDGSCVSLSWKSSFRACDCLHQDQKIVQPMEVKHQQHLVHAKRIYFSMMDTQDMIIVTGAHYPEDANFLILADNLKARQRGYPQANCKWCNSVAQIASVSNISFFTYRGDKALILGHLKSQYKTGFARSLQHSGIQAGPQQFTGTNAKLLPILITLSGKTWLPLKITHLKGRLVLWTEVNKWLSLLEKLVQKRNYILHTGRQIHSHFNHTTPRNPVPHLLL